MHRPIAFALALFAATSASAAHAEERGGAAALAFAALVAQHSPQVSPEEKAMLTGYLDGRAAAPARVRSIRVDATRVACRAGNVDFTAYSCDLTFGTATTSIRGRQAHEIFATLTELGVQSEGAAGSFHIGISNLQCLIDPAAIADHAGGGALCRFVPN